MLNFKMEFETIVYVITQFINSYLAQATQCSKAVGLVLGDTAAWMRLSVSSFMFCWAARLLSYAARVIDMYCCTSSGVCL